MRKAYPCPLFDLALDIVGDLATGLICLNNSVGNKTVEGQSKTYLRTEPRFEEGRPERETVLRRHDQFLDPVCSMILKTRCCGYLFCLAWSAL